MQRAQRERSQGRVELLVFDICLQLVCSKYGSKVSSSVRQPPDIPQTCSRHHANKLKHANEVLHCPKSKAMCCPRVCRDGCGKLRDAATRSQVRAMHAMHLFVSAWVGRARASFNTVAVGAKWGQLFFVSHKS